MGKKKYYKGDLREIQKQLAKRGELVNSTMTMTKQETIFGKRLIKAGVKVICDHKIDGYSFDFKVLRYPILIEVDGGIHNTFKRRAADYKKDRLAIKKGFIVLRFTNNEAGYTGRISDAVQEVKAIVNKTNECPKEVIVVRETFWEWLKSKLIRGND